MALALVGYCRQSTAGYFQFSTTTTIGDVAPSIVTNNNTDFVTVTTPAGTDIQFTGLATIGPENLVGIDGGTDLVFGLINLMVVNATPQQSISIPFTFNVTITDFVGDTTLSPSTGSGTFTVNGLLQGTIGAGRKAIWDSIVVDPVAPILIGTELYSMEFNTIVPPGPFFPGAIGARVAIVPEPATCAMLGLGLVGIAVPAFRRWRRKSA
jgi:hypothetical protein